MNDQHIGGGRDALDEKLIALLCQNARMSLTALSQAVALSRTAVQARIARLEREKVITGYTAVLARPLDENGVGAMLSITFSQHPCAPIAAKFRHWPEITQYYTVTGPIDAYMVVRVKNAQALAGLIEQLSGMSGVASVQSAVIL